ncbi:MAG: pimeloyl-CoA synthetase [Acidimicrobiales bacterium]|nr:pimeloyl-CoA synthetase [Acidimicrobiales bacterium]
MAGHAHDGPQLPELIQRAPVDVTGRPLALRPVDLARFFRPHSIAVVGASDRPGTGPTSSWRQLQAWGERVGAQVHPVNPKRASVDGVACVDRLSDLDCPIDVVAVLVADAADVVAEAVECGASFAVVFSAGYAEVGDEGRRAQEQLARLIEGSDLRLLGPNTNLNAFEPFRTDLDGPAVALITQSGHQGRSVYLGQELGVRISHWAPTGNEVDLEFADFAAWLAGEPEVGAIAAYVEGFRDGRTLMLAAERCLEAGVPITLVKVGATAVGRNAAGTHTGKLAGSNRLTDAVFRQMGITRVTELDDLLETSQVFARATPPARRSGTRVEDLGVAVYAVSGGAAAHMTDLCAAAHLRLPKLSPATQAELRSHIPGHLRVDNPVDCGGLPAGDERGRKILDALVADPEVRVIICPIAAPIEGVTDRLARDLVDVAASTDKLVCAVWASPLGHEAAHLDVLRSSSRLAVFRSVGGCVRAVRSWLDWHAVHQRWRSPFDRPALRRSPAASVASELLVPGQALSEHRSKQLLAAYGIPITRDELVTSASGAARAARSIGFPVVCKACGPDLLHKSDEDLVRLGLTSIAAVRQAYADLAPHGSEGVLVSEQVADGAEAVLGIIDDPLFGPAVMLGLGGIFIEVFNDVTFRVPPFDRAEARRMVDELEGSSLFDGVRGRERADIPALVDTLMKVQRMAVDLHDVVSEVDINPLMVLPRGRGVLALDGLVVAR